MTHIESAATKSPSMDDIYQVLLNMREDMSIVKTDVTDIKNKLDNINTRMEDLEVRTATLEDNAGETKQRLDGLAVHVDSSVLDIQKRIDHIEHRLFEQDQLLHPEYDPDKTIVASRLPDDDRSTLLQASSLLEDGLGDHTPVVRAMHLQSRESNPGIVKIELPTKHDKIRILRKKSNLSGKSPYENTFLRSSQPHVERLQAANWRFVLEKIPTLSGCMVTGNGRLVSRDNQQAERVFYNSRRSQQPADRDGDITDRPGK